MGTRFLILLGIFSFLNFCVAAVTGPIIYQGRLSNGNAPAEGSYDLRFTVYDAADIATGNVLATVVQNPVVVSNGLFMCELNLDAGIFDGNQRWLEIAVRTNGSSEAYSILSPRQAIAPAPYAIRAVAADSVTGAILDDQLSGNISRLNASNQIFTGSVVLTNGLNQLGGNGASLSNLNASSLSTGTVPDARLSTNVALRNTSNTFNGRLSIGTSQTPSQLNVGGQGTAGEWVSFANASNEVKWQVSDLNGGLNFRQTPLANGRLFLSTNGNVGINTTNPQYTLSANGTIASLSGGFRFPDGSVQAAAARTPKIIASVNVNFSLDDRSGWTHIENLGDDTVFPAIPLGFTYTGFGADTTAVSFSSNGLLFFGASANLSWSNTGLPSSLGDEAILFFYWDDLYDNGGSEFVEYITLGSPGGRVFHMYFRNRIRQDSSLCGSVAGITALISIHEGSNLIKVTYFPMSGCQYSRGAGATIGMQTAGGSAATAFTVGFNVPLLDDNSTNQTISFHPPN